LADTETAAAYDEDLFQVWLWDFWEDTLGDATSDFGRRVECGLRNYVGIATGSCG
jgi:hypothetical protein